MTHSRIDTDSSLILYAAESMLISLQALMKEREGVRRADDIEFIHRMRVASRRCRRTLDHFEGCFPKKQIKKWRQDIKMITRSLGGARDTDVQHAFLEKFTRRVPQTDRIQCQGLKRLTLRLLQKRRRLQKKVDRAMDRLSANNTLENMETTLRQIIVNAKLNHTRSISPAVGEKAYRSVMRHLEEFLSYTSCVGQPLLIERHHEMRIAAKRLRYTLEIFEKALNKEVRPFIRVTRKIQDHLGEIHDADVWISLLPEFIDEEKEFTRQFYGHIRGFSQIEKGLRYLLKDRQETRQKIYHSFLTYWDDLKKRDIWEKLRAVVSPFHDRYTKFVLAEKARAVREAAAASNTHEASRKTAPRTSAARRKTGTGVPVGTKPKERAAIQPGPVRKKRSRSPARESR